MNKYVQIKETPTAKFILISEPGGQINYKHISCTLEEAFDIFSELGDVLEPEFKKYFKEVLEPELKKYKKYLKEK